ncbi:MAG: IS630 family transposase, partial [Candidatus Omnitrophota bacterium]
MKIDGRCLSHDVLEGYRLAAINLYKSKVDIKVIAGSFGVTLQAVYKWIWKFQEKGIKSLKSTTARGVAPQLNENQFKELIQCLRQPAAKSGYATDLWSGPRVRHLIKKMFKIEYHPKHMPRFLHRLGLYLKKPERRALEQDSQEVRFWKYQRLPEILAYARKNRALLFYADESLIPYVGKTWAFPKARPIARVSGRRGQHVGITAAVNEQGRMCFELTQEGETFTSRIFLRFVRKLRKESSSRKIVLIVDGAPIHIAKVVREFQKKHEFMFRLEILPAYSPEFNPTEKTWGFVKTKKLNA